VIHERSVPDGALADGARGSAGSSERGKTVIGGERNRIGGAEPPGYFGGRSR